MTLTTHAAAGMLVAQWTQRPLLGFFVGMLSHYILDAIPHGDEFIYWRAVHNLRDRFVLTIAAADTTALILLYMAVTRFKTDVDPLLMALGLLGGILPDLAMNVQTQVRIQLQQNELSPRWERIARRIDRLLTPHDNFHKWCHDLVRTPVRLGFGLSYQLVFIVLFFFFFVA